MDVSLTPEMERWINEKVENGQYGSADEVIYEALRLLKERTEDPQLRLVLLRRDIALGLEAADRGETKPFDPEDLKRRVRKRLAEGAQHEESSRA